MEEIKLMKGNEVIAEAAIRCGCDGYFGYPITPQSEILETLSELRPWETTGMVVIQAESETAAINLVYGGAACKKVMTSSSSPGISLMSEGLSYLAGAELPCLVVDVTRGGPGLGTIQPSQADYFQVTKGGGHGDYHLIVLAPYSVQEMYDFVSLGFDLAFKYLNQPRWTNEYIAEKYPWALTGKPANRKRNIATSLELEPLEQEKVNQKLQRKYADICANEVRYETLQCEDADYVLVAYGSSARISSKVVEMAREQGIKAGLLRPVTLYPFPYEPIAELSHRVKGFLSVEMSAGQMIEDVRLAVEGRAPVYHYGRMGGVIHSPDEVFGALKSKFSL